MESKHSYILVLLKYNHLVEFPTGRKGSAATTILYNSASPLQQQLLTRLYMPCSVTQVAPRFEIKKWNAVAMWSWDICADTCAICRNSLNEPSIEYQVGLIIMILLW